MPPDKKYINAFKQGLKWGLDPDADPGSGLWCVKPGEHVIYFDGPDSVSERILPPVKKMQGYYIASIPK